MPKFTDYLDQYPHILPSEARGPALFKPAKDDGSFFQKFLALQANPQAAIMQKMYFPERLKQFMALSGGQ